MADPEISRHYEKLREEIIKHNRLYYQLDTPEISDLEYDLLLRELEELELKYPELKTADSPTQTVGAEVSCAFNKVRHSVQMQSLQDYFSEEEMKGFISKTAEETSGERDSSAKLFSVEEKIDGLSVALTYKNGAFTGAATRGDGFVGEDVTANMMTIQGLPLKIQEKLPLLVVRAEAYMPEKIFKALNKKQSSAGEKLFANPRNAAAGSLRQLDPSVTAERGLSFFVFNVQEVEGKDFKTHAESLDFLKAQGFPVIHYKLCDNENEVLSEIRDISFRRESLLYDIDGAVVKINELKLRKLLGESSKVPKWAAAYKYHPETAQTRLRKIIINVGRTGRLSPLALLDPVILSGSTVSRATLHNEDYISERDIREGDSVIIQKAGDIIPAVVSVNFSVRPKESVPFEFPRRCPVCGSAAVRLDGEAGRFCTNLSCPAQRIRHLEHFVSKAGMDIAGLGPSTIKLFTEKGLIHNIIDIFRLTEKREALITLPGFGVKSADKLIQEIENAKTKPLENFISALGISQIGGRAAAGLAEYFGTLNAVRSAGEEEFLQVPDIGRVSAEALYSFFSDEKNRLMIDELISLGLRPEENTKSKDEIAPETLPLFSKSLVFTGTLSLMSRQEAQKLAEKAGAVVRSQVSAKTDYLVEGEDPGAKADKALKLGIKIINEAEFVKLAGGEEG